MAYIRLIKITFARMNPKKTSQLEFIALMASLMAMVALAIDALLPALPIIGNVIGTSNPNDNQLLITMIFLGLGVGQLAFGPLSDSFGRKPIVYTGFIIFIIASFICVYAKSLEMMVFGRILQGIGLSAPRTISISMIRDAYEGDHMARIMSFVTVIFIIVPTIAPALGKFILDAYNWQTIFFVQLFFSLLICIWFWLRQRETLKEAHKIAFNKALFIDGFKELISYKNTIGYTMISGLITGSFMVYLSASQQVFQQQYGLVDEFPFIFAGLAIAVGSATFINGKIVLNYGMMKLVHRSLYTFCISALVYILVFHNSENPSITILLSFFAVQFFSLGFLFGNLRALAMQPIGHIAGIGAAITGFISTLMAVPIGTYIGSFINTTALPLFIGFFICGVLSLLLFYGVKYKVKTIKGAS